MAPTEWAGDLDGRGLRIGIAVARFNEYLTRKLLDGAVAKLRALGVADDDMTVAWVPGSFELPAAAKALASRSDIDAVICLGCIIKGSTAHFEYVAGAATQGITQVALEFAKPVIFGVLTTYDTQQAAERADPSHANLGAEFAASAVEMVSLGRKLKSRDDEG